jgi:outer membrane protein assembly factor BamB
MQVLKNKAIAIATAIFLSASIALAIIPFNFASAHTPQWQIPTFAHIFAAPNPIGVGQTTYIDMFLANAPFDPATAVTNTYRYRNYILTITAPDGSTNTTTFDYISDPTANQAFSYTPTQVGTYTLNFTFPGQAVTISNDSPTSAYINDSYLSSSASATLIVQQEPISLGISSYPLPTEYWTRPIYGENTDWWSISSNWLGQGAPGYFGFVAGGTSSYEQSYPGDAVGPQTSHIMWTKPLQSGGVAGGNNFAIQGDTYFEGSAYLQRFANPIVVNARIYYTEPLSFSGAPNGGFGSPTAYGPTDCIDLRTGQLIWSRADVPPLSFGYIYSVQDPNQKGVYPAILFTANFARAFDADTGTPLFNVTGVPSVNANAMVVGPQGEQLRYVMANAGTTAKPDWRLGEWNSSKLWSYTYPPNLSPTLSGTVAVGTGTAVDGSISTNQTVSVSSLGATYTFLVNRYDWNVSIPWMNTMPAPPPGPFGPSLPATITNAFYNNMLICYNGTLPSNPELAPTAYTYFAINLDPNRGAIGSVLWWNTVQPPAGNESVLPGGADPTVNVFVEAYRESMRWVGYSMTNGQKLWGPTDPQTALDYFGNTGVSYVQGTLAYGKLYSSGYGGIVYAYDLTNGNILWTYGNGGEGNSTNSGFNYAGGPYPTFITAIGNGYIYLVTSAHTATNPIYKGALTRCINATTGQEIWTLSDYTSTLAAPFSSPVSYAIADGLATFFNGYDNQIYSVGRGPSTLTVSASKVQTLGGNVVIDGTVMDVSAGTMQNEQAARFANGVPVASDASMKDWMGYVYQQKPLPTNFTGVNVSISVIDANGNQRNIGSATTDAKGYFTLTWLPDIPGNFKVIATFSGTNGYWPSSSVTSFNVMEAHPTATPTPAPPASNTDMYILGSAIAIIIVIIIVGALIVMMQRKRP